MDRDDRLVAYLQDRLSQAERKDFEAEMRSDPALAAEVSVMRGARKAMGQEEADEDPSVGWQRLQASIERERSQTTAANLNRRPFFMIAQVAAVAIAAIAVWQFAVTPLISPNGQPGYTTASDELALPVLQVVFADTAPAGEISAALLEHGGKIIDGPSAIGLYRIAFPDEDHRSRAREALALQPELVESVFIE